MPAKNMRTGRDIRVSSAPKKRKSAKRVASVKALPSAKKTAVVVKSAERQSLQIGMHLIIAGSAIAVLMLLGIVDRVTFSTLGSRAEETVPTTIGIEHGNPLTLSVLVARKADAGYISITNRSSEVIHISVPSSWKRVEVSGAPLSSITQDIPVFGFTRWILPSHAGIKLVTNAVPTALFFDSTSTESTAVDLETVDLADQTKASRVVLLQKQALAKLWGSEE